MMEPARTALLQNIFDHPQDDHLRLVYADWLEEFGDEVDLARAQYIRLALQKAKLPRTHEDRSALQSQMSAMLKAHRDRWFSLSPLLRYARRHRGFVRHARGTAAQFNEHAGALFATEPVTSFYLEPGGSIHSVRDHPKMMPGCAGCGTDRRP
jgi:uncharacterized protein (TIGR02996 family)